MAFFGPLELARLALVRADVVAAIKATMDQFEKQTGERTYVISGWRSNAEQEATETEGQAEGFRAAPANLSRHPLGAAVDLGILHHVTDAHTDQKDPLYKTLAAIAVKNGLGAGFNFTSHPDKPDPYHFEAKESLSTSQAQWAGLIKERLRRTSLVGAGLLLIAAIFYGVKHSRKR